MWVCQRRVQHLWGQGESLIHGRSCSLMHNTGSFIFPGWTAQCTAMTKQGSCATFLWPSKWKLTAPHHPLSAPQPPNPANPTLAETLPGVSYRIHSSQMQTVSPPLPLSPQSTLRNHQPCQVQADPAALCVTVGVIRHARCTTLPGI